EGIVRHFVEEGASVVFSGRSDERAKALEEELGKYVAFYRADAANASETEALMKFALERFGRLDCVVNNADEAPSVDQWGEGLSKVSIRLTYCTSGEHS